MSGTAGHFEIPPLSLIFYLLTPIWVVLPRLCRLHLPGYRQDDAHLRQLDGQRRAAIAEKRQGDAGGGQQARHHADVQKGLKAHQGHDAHHHQAAEPVPGMEGDPEAPENQRREQQHDNGGANQAQLLADDGEDEIVVLLRQIEKLLAALPQAHSPPEPMVMRLWRSW